MKRNWVTSRVSAAAKDYDQWPESFKEAFRLSLVVDRVPPTLDDGLRMLAEIDRLEQTRGDWTKSPIGIADKTGRPIHEGDVVKTPNGDWGVIRYEAPYFGVTVSPTQVSCYTRNWLESCEVIGNIYDNPELLSR